MVKVYSQRTSAQNSGPFKKLFDPGNHLAGAMKTAYDTIMGGGQYDVNHHPSANHLTHTQRGALAAFCGDIGLSRHDLSRIHDWKQRTINVR